LSEKIKGFVQDLEDVSEVLRPFYKQLEDGSYELEVEGKVSGAKLAEFRNTNTDLMRKVTEKDTKLAAYEAILDDPAKLADEYKSLKGVAKRVADNELVEKKGLEEAVLQRTSEMRATFEGQVKALQDRLGSVETERDAAAQRYTRSVIDRAISDAALAGGVQPHALPDVLNRSRDAGWALNEQGKLIQTVNGVMSFGADGASPLTPKEWVNGALKDTAPHFFATPHGLNAVGGTGGGGSKNPFTKDGWNMTEQGRIAKENPVLAKTLAANAGYKLDL
jgi:hypothetical protein